MRSLDSTLSQVAKVKKMKIKVHYISLVKSFTKTSQDEFDFKKNRHFS